MDPVSKIRQEASGNTGKNKGLANLRPWKKGESGNPSGRPKKKPITEIYEELLGDPKAREQIKKRIFQTLKGKGMAGVLERREAAERIEGKVVQPIEGSIALTELTDEELKLRAQELLSKA